MPKAPTVDVLPIFRTLHQAQILRLLLLQPERKFKGTDLVALAGIPKQTVSDELKRLVGAGIVEEEGLATAKLYRAATDSPFYEHLRALVQLALGPEAELRPRLSAIDGVDVAAVFGSWARGGDLRPTSDIDVLVVGNARFEDVADAVAAVEETVRREIQVVPLTWEELDERLASDSGFVKNVLEGPLTPLVGDVERLKERRRG